MNWKEFFRPSVWKIVDTFILACIVYGLATLGFFAIWSNPPYNWFLKVLIFIGEIIFGFNELIIDILPFHPLVSLLIIWISILYILSCFITLIYKKFKK